MGWLIWLFAVGCHCLLIVLISAILLVWVLVRGGLVCLLWSAVVCMLCLTDLGCCVCLIGLFGCVVCI